jgi:tRNA threonylcarbamoyladenosine biosynthesis protein TsaE
MNKEVASIREMMEFGMTLGAVLPGGITIEMLGDVGAGKTTLAKGIAQGLGVTETVQSPTFTLSRVYGASNGVRLCHYDFYRLHDAGVMALELEEAVHDPAAIVLVEWSEIVASVLPQDRLRLTITAQSETSRLITIEATGPVSAAVVERLA